MPLRKVSSKLGREELKQYALRVLGARAISTAQLKAKLRTRAGRREDVDEVVASLRAYGFLNDSRFAEGFATARRDSRGFGRQRVMADLVKQRVAPAVARKAVDQAYAGTNETAMIEAFLARKYRGADLPALLADERKLAAAYRRLRAAGFSSSQSIRVLKRFSARADDLESMETDSGVEQA